MYHYCGFSTNTADFFCPEQPYILFLIVYHFEPHTSFIYTPTWEPSAAQVTKSYSRHLPALERFYRETGFPVMIGQTNKQRLQLFIYTLKVLNFILPSMAMFIPEELT